MSTLSELPINEHQLKDTLWAFAVQSIDHAVLILDAKGDVAWCNHGASVTLGADAPTLIGMNLARIFLPADVELGIPEHEIEEARSKHSALDDRWLQRLDGSQFWASGVTVHLEQQNEQCCFVKIFRDLTDAKMQMEEARESCRSAKKESEGKSFAIAMLAHELRNPLSGVNLATGMLQVRTQGDERIAKPLGIIEQNVAMASRLIDDLLEQSKIQSPGFVLECSRCDIRQLLQECIDIATRQSEQPVGRIEPLLLPRGRLEAIIDRNRMQQVFVNLITNSLRYTPPPGRIWISGTREETELVIRVTDEGAGIAPEKLHDLFQVFTLPGLESSRLGLGLGLMVVKRMVEAHAGTVQAKSDGPGHGSEFIVRFPSRLRSGAPLRSPRDTDCV